MNWVFLDVVPWDYDVATPLARPLGGSQSAMCYLTTALARRGHAVATITATSKPGIVNGVHCHSNRDIPFDLFAAPDTVTVVNSGPADIAAQLRQTIPHPLWLVLWTGHAHDQPAICALRDAGCSAIWDRIVCVSDWQRATFHDRLGVPQGRIEVLRNAISPAFEGLFRDAGALAEAKSAALRLAYTSTPFRGLDVLVSLFPELRRTHPACRLEVFSSMEVYGESAAQDRYQHLYALCRTTQGIDYRGSIAQPQLAKELRGVGVLAYPNTFAETSCISVMEALAAGAVVVTSSLGALPETCNGWARLVEPIGPGRTREQFSRGFLEALDEAIAEMQSDRTGFVSQRFRQVEAITRTCTWDVRAAEWEQAAAGWKKAHG